MTYSFALTKALPEDSTLLKRGIFNSKNHREAQRLAELIYKFVAESESIVHTDNYLKHPNIYVLDPILDWGNNWSYNYYALNNLAESVFGFAPKFTTTALGVFRGCFIWSDELVVKVAKYKESCLQNLIEGELFAKYPEATPEVYFVDPYGRFLIVENLSKTMGPYNFIKAIDNNEDFLQYTRVNHSLAQTFKLLSIFLSRSKESRDKHKRSYIYKLTQSDTVKAVTDLVDAFPQVSKDLHEENVAIRNGKLLLTDLCGQAFCKDEILSKFPHITPFIY